MYVVNGVIDKCEANFQGKFQFYELGQTRIVLGNYPNSEADVKALDDIGVTGILSCVTKDEIS